MAKDRLAQKLNTVKISKQNIFSTKYLQSKVDALYLYLLTSVGCSILKPYTSMWIAADDL